MPIPPCETHGSRIPQELDLHVAHLATLNVSVPCKTASDALLASFVVDSQLDPALVDRLLTLFHINSDTESRSFDNREVTFRDAGELHRHVAEEKRKVAERRAWEDTDADQQLAMESVCHQVRVPLVVVDMAAQQLANEIPALSKQIEWDVGVFFGQTHWRVHPREADLLSMALVHRSWTALATRALRQRVRITGASELNGLVSSPRMGPWIRELYFKTSANPVTANEDVRSTISHLGSTLSRTPHLQQLAIRTGSSRATTGEQVQETFRNVVDALKNMQALERLWLIQDQGNVACLPGLCEALAQMPRLRTLDIRNWTQGPGEGPQLNARLARLFTELPSPSRITTLSIAHGGSEEVTQGLVAWLLGSDPSTSSLKYLEVHSKDFLFSIGTVRPMDVEREPDPWPLHRALLPFMHLVETLRIHCAPVGVGTIHGIVRAATKLKKLSIIGAMGFTHFATTPDTLSDSIEFLHLHFSIYPATALRLRQSLADQDFLPRLRSLRLTKDPLRFDEEVLVEEEPNVPTDDWQIDEVRRLSEERNIAVHNDYMFLSLDELCEMSLN